MEVEELDDDGDDDVMMIMWMVMRVTQTSACAPSSSTFRLAKRHRAGWGGEVADEGVPCKLWSYGPCALLHVAAVVHVVCCRLWSSGPCGLLQVVELWSVWSVAV